MSNESSVNTLEQYDRRNNIVVSGIPGHVSARDLEETVISVLSDIEVMFRQMMLKHIAELGNQIGTNKKNNRAFSEQKMS